MESVTDGWATCWTYVATDSIVICFLASAQNHELAFALIVWSTNATRSVPHYPRGEAIAELGLIIGHDCLVNHQYRIGIKVSPLDVVMDKHHFSDGFWEARSRIGCIVLYCIVLYCIVLYWRSGHCYPMHCDLFKIYCAPSTIISQLVLFLWQTVETDPLGHVRVFCVYSKTGPDAVRRTDSPGSVVDMSQVVAFLSAWLSFSSTSFKSFLVVMYTHYSNWRYSPVSHNVTPVFKICPSMDILASSWSFPVGQHLENNLYHPWLSCKWYTVTGD